VRLPIDIVVAAVLCWLWIKYFDRLYHHGWFRAAIGSVVGIAAALLTMGVLDAVVRQVVKPSPRRNRGPG
jgi:hypothetical protein